MPLIREALDYEGHFTQIPNAWLRDTRLSLKSIGLLGQLLSHREGWSVTIDSIARANNCGRDLIRSSVRELEEAGYLARRQDRDETGTFAQTVWITTSPMSDYPTTGDPTTVNPQHKKTIRKKTISTEHAHRFDDFWESYPRRVGKKAAQRAWELIDESIVDEVVEGVRRMAADPNLPPKQYIPYPATWLNRGGWDDEPYPTREDLKGTRPAAEGPGRGDWIRSLHEAGEHFACDHD